MSKINDGGPAFPNVPDGAGDRWADWDTGMSLRDYFAAKAMCSAMDLSPARWWNEGVNPAAGTGEIQRVAKVAYTMADAMLAARGAQ
ncbi:hypothetical protein [Achromobacter arsenitoxydans]|uniref:Uncharacterized protein n=1 Tax=Achromobacter arsenitoxydans SY8 TaxID=477184 RepID=H0F746_9BURK|nr:hypothetical protein [Achromobacter arsenitoxydans]EHK65960.1 hypothetical protein KYC_12563 [Achromobacter arsenitoxydans SY8]